MLEFSITALRLLGPLLPWYLPSLQVQIRKRQVPGSGRHTSAMPDGVAMPPVLQDMVPQKSLPRFAVTRLENSENSLRTE